MRVWDGVERIQTLLYYADRPLDCTAAAETLEPETALDRQVESAGGAAARLRLRLDDGTGFMTRTGTPGPPIAPAGRRRRRCID